MARWKYIPGDNWVICDRCGRKRRRSDVKKQWNGLVVCADTCWEERHPQEFLRTKSDDIYVPDARPSPPDTYLLTYSTTTLAVNAYPGDTSITVASASSISDGDYIAVILDDGTYQWITVSGSPAGSVVTLSHGLLNKAASGNEVRFTNSLGSVSASDL